MHLKWEKVDIVMTGAVYSQRGLLLCWRVELWGGVRERERTEREGVERARSILGPGVLIISQETQRL